MVCRTLFHHTLKTVPKYLTVSIQSTTGVYTMSYDSYGPRGPNLCAPGRDRMGWMPSSRIYTLTRFPQGGYTTTHTLTSLSRRDLKSGYTMIRIPAWYAYSQIPFLYFTVEYRTPDGYDYGLSSASGNPGFTTDNGIVIHSVNETGYAPWAQWPVYDGTSLVSSFYRPGDIFNYYPASLQIRILSTDKTAGTAVIQIDQPYLSDHALYGPNTCKTGYVWREGDAKDLVCVTPTRRTQVANENAASASHKAANGYDCLPNYVFRGAWPNDQACVTVAQKVQGQSESKQAYSYVANDWGSGSIVTYPITPVVS